MGKAKLNIPMCAALVLFLLTMISVHMTSGLYARYTATASGSDSARVAKFDVDCAVTPDGVEPGKFTLSVTNNSEVAVKYSINVTFTAPMSVTVGEETKTPEIGKNTVTFTSETWVLAPGADPAAHTMQFVLTDWTYITEDQTGASASKDATFTVNVTAEQVD